MICFSEYLSFKLNQAQLDYLKRVCKNIHGCIDDAADAITLGGLLTLVPVCEFVLTNGEMLTRKVDKLIEDHPVIFVVCMGAVVIGIVYSSGLYQPLMAFNIEAINYIQVKILPSILSHSQRCAGITLKILKSVWASIQANIITPVSTSFQAGIVAPVWAFIQANIITPVSTSFQAGIVAPVWAFIQANIFAPVSAVMASIQAGIASTPTWTFIQANIIAPLLAAMASIQAGILAPAWAFIQANIFAPVSAVMASIQAGIVTPTWTFIQANIIAPILKSIISMIAYLLSILPATSVLNSEIFNGLIACFSIATASLNIPNIVLAAELAGTTVAVAPLTKTIIHKASKDFEDCTQAFIKWRRERLHALFEKYPYLRPKKRNAQAEAQAKAAAEAAKAAAEQKTAEAQAKAAAEQKTAEAQAKAAAEQTTAEAQAKAAAEQKTAEAQAKAAAEQMIRALLEAEMQDIDQKLDQYECPVIMDAPDNPVRIPLRNGKVLFFAYEVVTDMLSQGLNFNPKTREPWPFDRIEDVQVDTVTQEEISRLKQARGDCCQTYQTSFGIP